jgi:ACS family D-galactonate transporter-like MFS transporter
VLTVISEKGPGADKPTCPAISAKDKVGVVGGVMNFAGNANGIALPIITGLILQATGACLTVLFFAGSAALYAVGSLLIDFRQAEAR